MTGIISREFTFSKPEYLRIAVVVADFHSDISEALLEGVKQAFIKHNLSESDYEVFHVPGVFEIPFTTKKIIDSEEFQAVIALGVVVNGQTDHYNYVCQEVARGLMELNLLGKIPVIFEVLMVDNISLAQARASRSDMSNNKGYTAGLVALKMVTSFNKIAS